MPGRTAKARPAAFRLPGRHAARRQRTARPAGSRPGPEALALRSERQAQVQEALAKLPEDQRLAVVLCDVQGYAYEEIALVMHCSLGTVKSRIARGREKLRVLLVSRMEQMSGHERP
jgi:RNA polymerase sigma-70 factor (ECF subfamily)